MQDSIQAQCLGVPPPPFSFCHPDLTALLPAALLTSQMDLMCGKTEGWMLHMGPAVQHAHYAKPCTRSTAPRRRSPCSLDLGERP